MTKTITLMRHGKPILAPTGWLAPRELAAWIANYERSQVEPAGIPAASVDAATGASTVVTSTAARALASARALGRADFVADPLFCEAQLPHALWRFPALPAAAWAALFRLLWLGGYARGADSYATTMARAGAASARLAALAAGGPVLLVGHGIMNRLIAQQLRKAGWREHQRQRSHYWSATTYSRA